MSTYALQLDTTGTSQDNLITEEYHTLTESNYKDYAFIVPDFAPFFVDTNTLKVEHIQTDGSRKTLVMNIDFYPCLQFVAATRSIGKEVWGGISFVHRGIQGKIVISYQSLGGVWVTNRSYILESLHERNVNPRVIYWDSIEPDTIPESFPVIEHEQDYDTIKGQDGVIAAIDRLAVLVQNGGFGVEYSKHLNGFNNPHRTTLEQLGYTIATIDEVNAGTSETSLITAKNLYDGTRETTSNISKLNNSVANIEQELVNIKASIVNLANRIVNTDTTLSNNLINEINNLKQYIDSNIADTIRRIEDVDAKYDLKVSVLNDGIIDQLREHINNEYNPHNVTKDQVGLGNIENYPLATDLDVRENLAVDKYITLRQLVTYMNSNPSHVLKDYPTVVNVGDSFNITLATERVTSGTLYVWKISNSNTTNDMFEEYTGEFTVNNDSGIINIKVKDSIPKRGNFKFIVNVYQGNDETRLVCRTTVITLSNPGVDTADIMLSENFYDPSCNDEHDSLAELMWYSSDATMDTIRKSKETIVDERTIEPESDNDLYMSASYGLYNPVLRDTEQAELYYQSIENLQETIENKK